MPEMLSQSQSQARWRILIFNRGKTAPFFFGRQAGASPLIRMFVVTLLQNHDMIKHCYFPRPARESE